MENIKLIIDSSSNMKSDPDHNVEVVPLTISFGGKDYIDDQNLNIREFLNDMNQNQVAGKTTCPSIQAWLNALEGTEKAIIITMTSGMSGTFPQHFKQKQCMRKSIPPVKLL